MNISENLFILIIGGSAIITCFGWWLGFEMAELKFMPYLDCDYLFNDLDYYDRAQKEWVGRCLNEQ